MTTKAKAKQSPKPAAKSTPAKAPEPSIKVIKSGSCDSLSGKSVLSYSVGTDEDGETLYRIVENSGHGFYSGEWIAWSKIYAACEGHSAITSIFFRGLFRGKSVNSGGFLAAILIQESLVQRKAGKSRCYELTDAAHKQAPANAA